jgi:plasmid stabilization system protein ParE
MEIEVIWRHEALDTIEETFLYVSQFSPRNASRLANELYAFGDGLGLMPEKFKLCSQASLRKYRLHCVTFMDHLFVYDVDNNRVEILKIFHARMNPKKFKV